MPPSTKPRVGSSLIRRKVVSKRTPVYEEQARFFASLIDALVNDSTELFAVAPESVTYDDLYSLTAYDRFIVGGYACGFVCADFKPNFPLTETVRNPVRSLGDILFPALRNYIHTLLRAERHSYPYSGHVWEALQVGALALVSRRLKGDDRLYEAF